ncbi:hypothetical protein, partial [Lactobacillus jensenii]|uniref:hypothetical protein n=1 Tax=Lactobacillus jensenii TaxID=109790 RepID=UPI00286FCD57
ITELTHEKQEIEAKLKKISSPLGQVDAQISHLDASFTLNYDLIKDAATELDIYSVDLAQVKTKMKHHVDKLRDYNALTYELALIQAEIENTPEIQANLANSVKLHQMSLD